MDSITQAALGAAIGEAVLGKKIGNKGMLLGAAVATVPDLDVVLLPFFDQVQRISVHRGYSHSFFGVLVLSIVLTLIFSRWKKHADVGWQRWFLFSFLATVTHILLDAFTTFGTQLFLPFSDHRVAFDSITIVDPVYTLPLLIGITIAGLSKSRSSVRSWSNGVGIALSSLYLAFTVINKQSVDRVVEASLQKDGVPYESFITVPVSAANLLWYGVAKTPEGLYIGDYSVLDNSEDIQLSFFPTNEYLLEPISDTYLVDRMKWFSRNYYTVAEEDGKLRFYNLKCDMSGFAGDENEAPTTFYFEIETMQDGSLELNSGMHPKKKSHDWQYKLKRMFGQNTN